jgi:UPF0176 protein
VSTQNTTFVSIAAYKFVELTDLVNLRDQLRTRCLELELRGTILLSTEGINLFVSGLPASTETLMNELRAMPTFSDLSAKVSAADERPFNRMLVKIKKEIIAFGEDINPAKLPSRRVSASTLKQWLDEGRQVTLLDTRNDFEVELGTFAGALPIGTKTFREFPKAVERLPDAVKTQTVVTFCTGGIRCEKAAPYLERVGYENVFQLDGGILKYFEECGGAHFSGECFVFDRRVGLDSELKPTGTAMCFKCLMPVTREAQADPRYVRGEACPRCAEKALSASA